MSHRAPSTRRPDSDLGARLIIACFILCQFVDVTFGTVDGFVISAQKLAAIVVLPLGAVMMGRVSLPPRLWLCVGLAVVAFSTGPILGGTNGESMVGAIVALVFNGLAATLVYSALLTARDPFRVFGTVWIWCAVVSSLVAIGQSLDLLPLFTVGTEALGRRVAIVGLSRATAFKFDPNFAAMVLVVGLLFLRFRPRSPRRTLFTIVVVLGTAATLSRMGLIVAALVLVLTASEGGAVTGSRATHIVRRVGAIAAVACAGVAAYVLSTGALRAYLDERSTDLQSGLQVLLGGPGATTGTFGSATERAELVEATGAVIGDHWLTGVGPNNLQLMLSQTLGIDKGAHNTYLETIAIGGVFGLLLLVTYLAVCRNCLKTASRLGTTRPQELRMVRLLCWSVALMALVLTLDYNGFVWMPLTLCLALVDRGRTVAPPVELARAGGAR